LFFKVDQVDLWKSVWKIRKGVSLKKRMLDL
jgi:hypothetical protein